MLMPQINYLVGGHIYCYNILMNWISFLGICGYRFINCYFLAGGLDFVYRQNSIEFLVDFWELENLEIMSLGWVLGSYFSNRL